MPPLQHFWWTRQLLSTAPRCSTLKYDQSQAKIALGLSAVKRLQVAWKTTNTISGQRTDDLNQSLDCKPDHAATSHHHHDDHHHHEDPQADWYLPPVGPIVTRETNIKRPWYIGSSPVPSYRGAADYANEQWFEIWWAKFIRVIFWWTFWYNMLLEPGHVIGEYFIPDRYLYSDAELGVPPIS